MPQLREEMMALTAVVADRLVVSEYAAQPPYLTYGDIKSRKPPTDQPRQKFITLKF